MNKFLQEQFYIANAANYDAKHEIFYPLKRRLLKKLATPDGWDQQTITRECWSCHGTGIYDGYLGLEGCYKCNHTGIYYQRIHYLLRYKLGNRDYIYHTPVDIRPEGSPKNCFDRKLEHEPISSEKGFRALLWLTARYAPIEFLKLLWYAFRYYQPWHKHFYYCDPRAKQIVMIAALFAGWIPQPFENGVMVMRTDWHESIGHLNWVLNAYQTEPDLDDYPF